MSPVRPAVLADLDALVALNEEIQRLHHEALPERYRPPAPAELSAWFAERLGGEESTWLYEQDGRAVGYLCVQLDVRPATPFSPARRTLLIDQISVHSPLRGRGIGRALMARAEALARQHGCERIELDVLAFNREAIAFYEALGYAPLRHRLARDLSPGAPAG